MTAEFISETERRDTCDKRRGNEDFTGNRTQYIRLRIAIADFAVQRCVHADGSTETNTTAAPKKRIAGNRTAVFRIARLYTSARRILNAYYVT